MRPPLYSLVNLYIEEEFRYPDLRNNDTDVKTDEINDNTNQMLVNANAVCTSSCDNVTSGNVIICDNCGGVNIAQTCDTTSQCIMVQQLDQQLENLMSAIATQDVKQSQGMFSFDFSETDLKTNIKNGFNNSVTQIINTTCSTDATNLITNNVIVAKDSNKRPINITQDGSANSNCTINNLSTIVSKSEFDASSSQSLVQRNALVMIIVGIVAILIIAVLVVVVGVLGLGGLGVVGGATSGKGGGGKEKKSGGLIESVEGLAGAASPLIALAA